MLLPLLVKKNTTFLGGKARDLRRSPAKRASHRLACRPLHCSRARQAGRHAGRQAGRQAGRRAGRLAGRRAGGQAGSLLSPVSCYM